jgi:outer membrane autotransporter protein
MILSKRFFKINSVILVTLGTINLSGQSAFAGCGTFVTNGAGGRDYTIAGTETSACVLTANANLTITSSGAINTITSTQIAVNVKDIAFQTIINNGTLNDILTSANSSGRAGVMLDNARGISILNASAATIKSDINISRPANNLTFGQAGINLKNGSILSGSARNEGRIELKNTLIGASVNSYNDGIYVWTDSSAREIINVGDIYLENTNTAVSNGTNAYATATAMGYGYSTLTNQMTDILNSGNIETKNITNSVTNAATTSYGLLTYSVGFTGTVRNTGSIKTYDQASGAGTVNVSSDGMTLWSDVNLTGSMINAGTIEMTGVSTSNVALRAMKVNKSTVSGDVINAGTVTLNATGGAGATVLTSLGFEILESSIGGSLINSGNVKVEATGHITPLLAGIHLDRSKIDGGIRNSGTIDATGGKAVSFKDLTGNSFLYLEGNSRLIGDVYDNAANSGFSKMFVNTQAYTEGNYTISDMKIADGQKFTISAGNTVTLSNMDQSPGGQLAFEVSSPTSRGQLVVTNGNALDLTGLKILASVKDPATINVGDEFMVARGDTSIIGGSGAEKKFIDSNSIFFQFAMADGTAAKLGGAANELYFFVYGKNTITDVTAATRYDDLGRNLQEVMSLNNPEFNKYIDQIYQSSSSSQLNNFLETVVPHEEAAAHHAASNMMNNMFDMVSEQIEIAKAPQAPMPAISHRASPTGLSVGNGNLTESDRNIHVWGRGFGGTSEQEGRNSISGYDSKVYGGAVGIDNRHLLDDTVIGVSLGYAETHVKSHGNNHSKLDAETYQAMIYAHHELDDKNFITAMLSGAYSDNDQVRHNVASMANLNATSDFTSFTAGVRLGYGHKIDINDETQIVPELFSEYIHYARDGYKEKGAGSFNLNVKDLNNDALFVGSRVKATHQYAIDESNILIPEINLSYKYEVLDDNLDTNSSFAGGGTVFKMDSLDTSRHVMGVGAGVSLFSDSGWDVKLNYDYTHKSDYGSHAAAARIGYEF